MVLGTVNYDENPEDCAKQRKGNSGLYEFMLDEMMVVASSCGAFATVWIVMKQSGPLGGWSATLGLRLEMNNSGELMFRRGNEIPEVKKDWSRREVFFKCRKLMCHYPTAGWFWTGS